MDTLKFAPVDAVAVPSKPGVSVAFFPCPHFTLMPFAAIVDALRLTADDGDGSRQMHCRWAIAGPSLEPVEASCGIKVNRGKPSAIPAGRLSGRSRWLAAPRPYVRRGHARLSA